MSLVDTAHDIIATALNPGDLAIDATVGNGLDTLFLARLVGDTGRVYGFDIQAVAIDTTSQRLKQYDLIKRVTLFQMSHEYMRSVLYEHRVTSIAAIMFNLGYLPGGDKSIVTRNSSSISAIRQGLELLRPGGIASVLAYPGHPGGHEETTDINTAIQALDPAHYTSREYPSNSQKATAPRLFTIKKR